MGEQIIYVVGGQTGEYSDRNEWLTRAFYSEPEARALVDFLTAKRQELAPQGDHLDWERRNEVEKAMRAFDPAYSEDYTGTIWFVHHAPLSDPAPPSRPSSKPHSARTKPMITKLPKVRITIHWMNVAILLWCVFCIWMSGQGAWAFLKFVFKDA